MSMEDTGAPQGVAEAEPVASPVQTSDTGAEETANAEQPAEQTEQAEPKPEEAKRRPWFMDRIDRQGQRIAEQQRQLEELRAGRQDRGDQREEQHRQGNDDVDTRVNAALAQREHQARLNTFDAAGRKEFPDFVDRCNTVAGCGALDRPEFMQLVADMDDGHKIVAHLADHPDEAVRILGMTPARMALELGRMSAKGVTAKAAQQSSAPPPIRPIAGAGRDEKDDSKLSDAEWYAKWQKEHGPKG